MYFGLDNMSNVQPTTTLLCYPEIYFSSVPGYIGILYRLHDSCIFVHLSTSHSTQKKSMQIIFTRGSYIHEMYMYLHTLQIKYTLSFCYLWVLLSLHCICLSTFVLRVILILGVLCHPKTFKTYCLGSWCMWICLTLVMALCVRRISELSLISKVLLLRVRGDLPVMVIA